jgi:hypothetical protein
MILGVFDLHAYTILHVIISLIAIAAGFVVVFGMLRSQHMEGWTATFLITTILTSLTGFAFPFLKFTPAHAVGAISMVVLLLACLAFYFYRLAGNWRWIYVVSAVAALVQRVRAERAGVPEGVRVAAAGADAVGATVPDRAGARAGGVHRAGLARGAPLPPACCGVAIADKPAHPLPGWLG